MHLLLYISFIFHFQANFWSWPLSEKQVGALSDCSSDLEGDLVSWGGEWNLTEVTVESIPDNKVRIKKSYILSFEDIGEYLQEVRWIMTVFVRYRFQVCDQDVDNTTYVLLPLQPFYSAASTCKAMGGYIPSATTVPGKS